MQHLDHSLKLSFLILHTIISVTFHTHNFMNAFEEWLSKSGSRYPFLFCYKHFRRGWITRYTTQFVSSILLSNLHSCISSCTFYELHLKATFLSLWASLWSVTASLSQAGKLLGKWQGSPLGHMHSHFLFPLFHKRSRSLVESQCSLSE